MNNWRDLAIAGGIALCAAVVMGVALPSLSAPKDFHPRLEALETGAAEVRRLSRTGRGAKPMRASAVCADAGEAASQLRQTLSQDAAQLKLDISRVDVAPAGEETGGLAVLDIRFEAGGGYDAALAMLERLDRLQPQIFADTVDLTSRTSSVTISFSGRAFCAA